MRCKLRNSLKDSALEALPSSPFPASATCGQGSMGREHAQPGGVDLQVRRHGSCNRKYPPLWRPPMLKTLTMSVAISALMVSGALAQASPPADKPASQSMAQSNAAPVNSPHFIQAQGTDKWVFSKFKGSNVLG